MEEECILGEQAQMQPQGELMQEPLEALKDQLAREAGGGEEREQGKSTKGLPFT